MVYLPEIVQPRKPDSEHTLDFLWVSTFVCSRNKHSCLLLITGCPLSHYLWSGLTRCQSFYLATCPSAAAVEIYLDFLSYYRDPGGVEKDIQRNLSSFSPHSVICSLIFDRSQDGRSTFLPLCVENKTMLCYEFMANFEAVGGGLSFLKTDWFTSDKLLAQNVQ